MLVYAFIIDINIHPQPTDRWRPLPYLTGLAKPPTSQLVLPSRRNSSGYIKTKVKQQEAATDMEEGSNSRVLSTGKVVNTSIDKENWQRRVADHKSAPPSSLSANLN
jgi:hypothetical protein